MTQDERKTVINHLVTNCGCQEKDRETLNKLSDETLADMQKRFETAKNSDVIANAAKSGFRDSFGHTHVWNTEKNQFELKPEVQATNGPVTNSQTTTAPKTPDQILNEYLGTVPPEVKGLIQNALQTQASIKAEVVSKLVSNSGLSGDAAKQLETTLNAKTVDDLNLMLMLQGGNRQPTPQYAAPNFMGAAVTNGNAPTSNAKYDEKDVDGMIPPTINYAEIAASVK